MLQIKRVLSVLAIIAAGAITSFAQVVNVIPYPQMVELSEGICKVSQFKRLSFDSSLKSEASYLADKLSVHGVNLTMKEDCRPAARTILLQVDDSLPSEGYVMKVGNREITVAGGSEAGVFYAIQTLLQQIDAGELRCGTIIDSPRYPWRSQHYSRPQILEIADCLADSFVIMLDDMNRTGEQETWELLKEKLTERGIEFCEKIYASDKSVGLLCSPDLEFLTTL